MMIGARRWLVAQPWCPAAAMLAAMLNAHSAWADHEPHSIAAEVEAAAAEATEETHQDASHEELVAQPQLGLVACYTDRTGRQVARIEPSLTHAWKDRPPDPRLAQGPFDAAWRGWLSIAQPGVYRLALWCRGEASLSINGQEICRGTSDQGTWLVGPPLELDFGKQRLAVRYKSNSGQGELSLAWTGPQFELEVVPTQALTHDLAQAPSQLYDQGRRLVRVLRCGACHDLPAARNAHPPPLAAPDLSRAALSMHEDWLIDWLSPATGAQPPADAASGESRPQHTPQTADLRPMPEFGLARREAEALAAWLNAWARKGTEVSHPPPKGPSVPAPTRNEANADGSLAIERGSRLFHTLGCLACHSLNGLGHSGPESGGALDKVAAKRRPEFFSVWLKDPAAWNPQHRMPVFELEPQEVHDLSAFLATLRGAGLACGPGEQPADRRRAQPRPVASKIEAEQTDAGPALVRDGERLYKSHRCAACHGGSECGLQMPVPMPAMPRWEDSCLQEPDPRRLRPGYRLPAPLQAAVIEYYSQQHAGTAEWLAPSGADLLHEHRCLACHARGSGRGLSEELPALLEAQPELAGVAPALAPPSLDGVGDKLHSSWLAVAISRRGPSLRPWLAVRMPKFRLTDDDVETLTEWLVVQDRLPAFPPPELDRQPAASLDVAALEQAGRRLVTADGFGCTSCHAIGRSMPEGVALAARGTSLSLVGERVRREWFVRWVRNPLRLTPRIEMPAIQQPVPGVLDDHIDTQLAAVWRVLNLPGFDPPQPNPIRVARTHNVPDLAEPPVVITDLVELEGQSVVRPVLVGLPNRNNILFDLETASLAAWWLGDTARQRTRGKSWYWEAGATPLVQRRKEGPEPQPELELTLASQRYSWQLETGLTPALDAYEYVPAGLRLTYRLQAVLGDSARAILVQVSQTFSVDANHPQGFVRDVVLRGVPQDAVVRLRVLPEGVECHREHATRLITNTAQIVELLRPAGNAALGDHAWVELVAGADGVRRCTLRYLPAIAPDRYAPVFRDVPAALQPLDEIVPGWQAVRLPLPPADMITSLAWRADGSLVYTSLKGGVRLARDTDGDGCEERCRTIADGLPAPYGVATPTDPRERWVDVLCKYGLVRLYLDETDGLWRAETVASGWGWTADYHDWAVGLPRDRDGAYYIALPCQQDERPPSAATLRGTVLKLVPCEPAEEAPRRYRLETIAAGLRFPMGLALDTKGRLFATDNQGNYNPFNELNHIVRGAHYGFINRLEQQRLRPALETAAIEIPHPWTRSVNGICFLISPGGGGGFGPFEGHLVGCEYDTRRLIRMTLQEVRGVVQGAAYPFSLDPPPDAGLEGPVSCGVGPNGSLYIGNLRDSGWGGGRNTGSLVRLSPPRNDIPVGIREVLAWSAGLDVHFTRPVLAALAGDARYYRVLCYRRASTPEYGGPNLEEQTCRVKVVCTSPDSSSVRLAVSPWKPGFVYELRAIGLVPAGERFFPAEAHYTLKVLP